jgi:hypothetical protein
MGVIRQDVPEQLSGDRTLQLNRKTPRSSWQTFHRLLDGFALVTGGAKSTWKQRLKWSQRVWCTELVRADLTEVVQTTSPVVAKGN